MTQPLQKRDSFVNNTGTCDSTEPMQYFRLTQCFNFLNTIEHEVFVVVVVVV